MASRTGLLRALLALVVVALGSGQLTTAIATNETAYGLSYNHSLTTNASSFSTSSDTWLLHTERMLEMNWIETEMAGSLIVRGLMPGKSDPVAVMPPCLTRRLTQVVESLSLETYRVRIHLTSPLHFFAEIEEYEFARTRTSATLKMPGERGKAYCFLVDMCTAIVIAHLTAYLIVILSAIKYRIFEPHGRRAQYSYRPTGPPGVLQLKIRSYGAGMAAMSVTRAGRLSFFQVTHLLDQSYS